MQLRAIRSPRTTWKSLPARLLAIGLAVPAATLAARASMIPTGSPGVSMSSAAPQVTIPQPVAIGGQIAGTFEDATGHSGQSHLVYAANARVWWLFTLTSNADS